MKLKVLYFLFTAKICFDGRMGLVFEGVKPTNFV